MWRRRARLARRDGGGAADRAGAIGRRAESDEHYALRSGLAAHKMEDLILPRAEIAPRERAVERAAERRIECGEWSGERRTGAQRDSEH